MKMALRKIAILLTIHFVKNISAANMTGHIKGEEFWRMKLVSHMVRLVLDSGESGAYACGASVVNQDILLTAAHCFDNRRRRDKIEAFVGAEEDFRGALYLGSSFLIHELYDPETLTNDIALIKLESQMKLGQKVGRVVLMQHPPNNEISFIAGWGNIEFGGPSNESMKHILVSQVIYNREQCQKNWEGKLIPIGHFCAVNLQNLDNFLRSDSGSPLVVRHYIQVGIASFVYLSSDNSTNDTMVTGYVDTGYFYDWIHEHAKELFCPNGKKTDKSLDKVQVKQPFASEALVIPASLKLSFRKDYTYKEETKKFYKVHTVRRVWHDAKRQCQMEGATLFHPDDEVEAQVAWRLWKETDYTDDFMYLGMSDLLVEGVWETVEGRPQKDVYINWQPGEPNNAKNVDDCLEWRWHPDNAMNDVRCTVKKPFICSRSSLETNPLCDVSDPNHPKPTFFRKDYTLLEESRAFYKVHTIRRNFQDARNQCQKEGATLFYPENDVEAEAVMGLFKRSPEIPGETRHGWIYLGLTDRIIEGEWETVDGRPIRDVYHNWGRGEPNNFGRKEDCVLWRGDKTFNDYNCRSDYPFICKKSQRSLDWKLFCDVRSEPEVLARPPVCFHCDYTYIKETQAFYKVHTERKAWIDARKQCQMEEAILFYPDDEVDANIAQALASNKSCGSIYLGMSDLLNEGVWETVDGRSELDVYNCWANNEPNNAGGIEHCAVWRSDKKLNDYRCDEPYPFICKKSLSSLNL